MMASLVDLSARRIAAMVRAGEVSAREVLLAHLERIEERNPLLGAVVSLDPEGALRQADTADARQARGGELGPLHGLPIAFKDMGRTAGMRTTFGHPAFADSIPDADDLHVARLQAAGAIRIGKTNVPEFGAGSHTVNRVFGATRNPVDPRLSAGGSSGGACAALAAGFVPIADGSDMGGSLRNPASFCGVVGLRPTPGVVPKANSSNAFDPLGTVGPLARNVRDLALVFSVLAVPSPRDPRSRPIERGALTRLEPAALRGLRVAYAPDLGDRVPVDPRVRDVVARTAAELEELGAIVEPACPELDGADEAFRTLRAAEFDYELGGTLETDPDAFVHFLADNVRAGRRLTARDVIHAYAELTRLARQAAEFFSSWDVLLSPVSQVPPFPVEWEYPTEVDGVAMGDYLDWMRSAFLITTLGVPAISVPAGFTPEGLPVGVQLSAAAGDDVRLLSVALALEQALGVPGSGAGAGPSAGAAAGRGASAAAGRVPGAEAGGIRA